MTRRIPIHPSNLFIAYAATSVSDGVIILLQNNILNPHLSPLLKFNDGPILFLLLQRRLLLETLWTTEEIKIMGAQVLRL